MSGPALERLLAVQDLDLHITQLEHRRAALPERTGLTAAEAELAALNAERATATAGRDVLLKAQKELEAQIATITERRQGVEKRMYAATGSSARDLQAMDDEVHHLAEKQSELETEELESMEAQEPFDTKLAELAAQLLPMEARAAELRAEVAAGQVEIDAELATAKASRAVEAAELTPAIAERYEKLRTRMKGVGAARLSGHHCDGCHMEMSPVEADKIRALPEDTIATCDQCGRILVPV